MAGYSFVIFCLSVLLMPMLDVAMDSSLLTYYDLKVNQNEATCRLVNHPNLPENRRTLEGRDCMCDAECVEYKDCCKDSRYYYPNQQSQLSPYHCSETAAVYLKAQCAPGWTDQNIAEQCEKSIQPLEDEDKSLILHISNQRTRQTYGNAYCAACNHDQDMESWMPWTLGAVCGEAPAGYLKKPIYVQPPQTSYENNDYHEYDYNNVYTKMDTPANFIYPGTPRFVLDINLYVYNETIPRQYSFPIDIRSNIPQLYESQYYSTRSKRQQSNEIDFEKYADVADRIAVNAKYDPYNKKFVSKYNDKDFVCYFGSILPQDSEPELYTRRCVPFMETTCPKKFKDETIKTESSIHTNIVYDSESNRAYRNVDCARCNGVPENKTTGKPQKTRLDLSSVAKSGGSTGAAGTPSGFSTTK